MIRVFAIAIAPLLMAYSTGSSLPAVGSEGDVLTVSSGAWTSAAASGGGWTSVYEYDFTSEATNDWCNGDGCSSADDGTVSIDGKSWTLAVVGTPTTCQATNGTGIEYVIGSGNSCSVNAPLSTLVSGYEYEVDRVRVWIYAAITAPTVNDKWATPWLASAGNIIYIGLGLRQTSGVDKWTPYAAWNNQFSAITDFQTTTTVTDDVILLQQQDNPWHWTMMTGVYSAGWPTSGFVHRWDGDIRGYRNGGLSAAHASALDPLEMKLYLSSDEPSVNWKRIKIETRE